MLCFCWLSWRFSFFLLQNFGEYVKAIWLAVHENVRKANLSVKRNGYCSACLSSTSYSKIFVVSKETDSGPERIKC